MNQEYRAFFDNLRGLLQAGAVTYERAKELAKDKIDEMNTKGREIAKKHGKKFKPFSFAAIMR